MTTCRGCGALFTEGHDEQHWELLAQIQAERRQWADKESALIEENERLSAEGDALAAQVEAMRKAMLNACNVIDLAASVEQSQAVYLMEHVLAATPQQCLRDVQAVAAYSGYVAGWSFQQKPLEPAATQYAAKVRDGG